MKYEQCMLFIYILYFKGNTRMYCNSLGIGFGNGGITMCQFLNNFGNILTIVYVVLGLGLVAGILYGFGRDIEREFWERDW